MSDSSLFGLINIAIGCLVVLFFVFRWIMNKVQEKRCRIEAMKPRIIVPEPSCAYIVRSKEPSESAVSLVKTKPFEFDPKNQVTFKVFLGCVEQSLSRDFRVDVFQFERKFCNVKKFCFSYSFYVNPDKIYDACRLLGGELGLSDSWIRSAILDLAAPIIEHHVLSFGVKNIEDNVDTFIAQVEEELKRKLDEVGVVLHNLKFTGSYNGSQL